MNKILIVGVGQLGSRYLQGIKSSSLKFHITAVEPKRESIEVATQRIDEIPGHGIDKIKWCDKIPENQKYDLAIISTSAFKRLKIIQKVKESNCVKFWIIEKVLEQSNEALLKLKNTFKNERVVVNTPRRIMPIYEDIKTLIGKDIQMFIESQNFGIACNSIHFIDLMEYLTEKTLTSINTNGLNKLWHSSKRQGFFEIDGVIEFNFGSKSKLSISSKDSVKNNSTSIFADNARIDVFEMNQYYSIKNKKFYSKFLMQSQLVPFLLDDIFLNNQCMLTDLKDSVNQHSKLINALLNHWNNNMDKKVDKLHVT